MVHCTRTVERRFPTFFGWNAENLKKRQKDETITGGFGKSYLTETLSNDALRSQKDILAKEEERICAEGNNNPHVPPGNKDGTKSNIHKTYYRELVLAGKKMADAIAAFVAKLAEAPQDFRDKECFRMAAYFGRTLIGLSEKPDGTAEETVVNFTQAMADEDLNDPEFLEALEAMMKAIDTRLEFENFVPNFNLFHT